MPERPNYIQPEPDPSFNFTDREQLHNRVSNERFMELLAASQTIIHKAELSSNNTGEFLFVTTSRQGQTTEACVTFWGLGYHHYRERWVLNEWSWYTSNTLPKVEDQALSKEEALAILSERQDEIAHYGTGEIQSKRGRLFEMMADLTDEDAAAADIEDIEEVFDFDETDRATDEDSLQADTSPEVDAQNPADYLVDLTHEEIANEIYNLIYERAMRGVVFGIVTPEAAQAHLARIQDELKLREIGKPEDTN